MEFKEVVKNRYSCKKFNGRQVEDDKLQAILEAGRLAPTAKNLQEQHIYVIRSDEALAKIDMEANLYCQKSLGILLARGDDI